MQTTSIKLYALNFSQAKTYFVAALFIFNKNYATKDYADSAATAVKDELLNGAGEAYDTLRELGELIEENKDAIEALTELASESANTIKVNTDFGDGSYKATITISREDPTVTNSSSGDIWFKYLA